MSARPLGGVMMPCPRHAPVARAGCPHCSGLVGDRPPSWREACPTEFKWWARLRFRITGHWPRRVTEERVALLRARVELGHTARGLGGGREG